MSFAKEQKAEIILTTEKNSCCRRATLLGVLSAKAEIFDDLLTLTLDGDDIVSYVVALMQEFYGKSPDFSRREKGGRGKMLALKSKSAARYIANLNTETVFKPKCSCCTSAFLRGIYLAAGRVSDPARQHSFELGIIASRVDAFCAYFSSLGIELSVANRAGARTIYSRRSEVIEDFFALAGMNNTVFKLMNSKINSEVRNDANRISNCEMNNISKAVAAAGRQIELIKELERRNLLGSLPEDLLLTAQMRVRYEDMSLSQLAMSMSPPISKSGLSHRLNKLAKLAEALIAGNENT